MVKRYKWCLTTWITEIKPFDAIFCVFPELFVMPRDNKMTLGCNAFGNSLDAVRMRRERALRFFVSNSSLIGFLFPHVEKNIK
ncbi:hypothetical protein TNCT_415611 [Trichonephila clavata]|uniref:Uncharacterized protein n=1 Tax=Trichonephila clavata TaxID=2740835 RepID=A0A8X6JL24_TRICU|nr:hypothetical protein TNCT_415611 [Trichonephila clavata]